MRHQFNVTIVHRRNYSSRDFLVFPRRGSHSSFLTEREAEVEKWNGLLTVPKRDREWTKADLGYLWLNRPVYHPLLQINRKRFSGVSPFWSLGWSLTVAKRLCIDMCVCVRAGQQAVCSLHRLHTWLIPPCVLWCCFPILHSFRSFLVPKPCLHTTDSGNSIVFPSPEYWRRKVLHLFPQGRGLSRLPQFFFAPHTGILGSYPCPRQFQSPSFSAPSQGLWMRVVFLPHLFFLSGGWIIQGVCGRKGRAVVWVLLRWEMLTATVPGLWWKVNYRPDWWLLDALTRCQGFMCPALPPSQFLQDQKSTAYVCLKTFPKILESVGCDVQKPSVLHLNKVMLSSWLQGFENLANSFPNGDHNWLTLVKFHTKSQHSCSPLRRCLGSSCSQWLIRSVGLGAEYIGTRVLVKFSFELSVWGL